MITTDKSSTMLNIILVRNKQRKFCKANIKTILNIRASTFYSTPSFPSGVFYKQRVTYTCTHHHKCKGLWLTSENPIQKSQTKTEGQQTKWVPVTLYRNIQQNQTKQYFRVWPLLTSFYQKGILRGKYSCFISWNSVECLQYSF